MEARAEGSHLRRGMSVEDDRVNDDDVPPLWRGGDDMIERCECDRYSSRGCDVSRRCRLARSCRQPAVESGSSFPALPENVCFERRSLPLYIVSIYSVGLRWYLSTVDSRSLIPGSQTWHHYLQYLKQCNS